MMMPKTILMSAFGNETDTGAMSDLSPLLGEQRTTYARCELFRF